MNLLETGETLLKKVAPTLATALGGPLAGAAAAAIVDNVFPDKAEELKKAPIDKQIEHVLSSVATAKPEDLAKLKQLDNDFKIRMRELDVDIYKLNVEDTKSARKDLKDSRGMQISLSVVYSIGYFYILYCLMSGDVKVDGQLLALISGLIGLLTGALHQIMQFWFGSSHGSQRKDALVFGATNGNK